MNDVSSAARAQAHTRPGARYRLTFTTGLLALGLAACGGSSDPGVQEPVVSVTPPPVVGPRTYAAVSTFAGSGADGNIDSAGSAAPASFHEPLALVADENGNVYVADSFNHEIRKIAANGQVSTLAGSGSPGSADGVGSAASFNEPRGMAIDPTHGDLYVADYGNHKIRRISPAGIVTTVAGTGQPGDVDGAAETAQFNHPEGLTVMGNGVLWVADTFNHKIRQIAPDGTVSSVAGNGAPGDADGIGAAAAFNAPTGICLADSGDVFVGDSGNHKIRRIERYGTVSTLAGTGVAGAVDGDPAHASFFHPEGLSCGFNSTIYVADFDNHKVRMVLVSTGTVSTLAGTGNAGSADGDAAAASFNGPFGVAARHDGTVYIADAFNHSIRKLAPDGTVSTLAGTGSAGAADGVVNAAVVSFQQPFGIAIQGGITYVTDRTGGTLRRIAADGSVSTLVWSGPGGNLDASGNNWYPMGVAVAADGTVYVADPSNRVVRKVGTDGVLSVLAGNPVESGAADGTGAAASFELPDSLVVDPQGNLYLSDAGTHKIRKITPAGVVSTFAGTGTQQSTDGTTATASFDTPSALALDGLGNLYVYDAGSYMIRRISATGVVTTLAGSGAYGYADGKGAAATFDLVSGMAAAADGTLYVADTVNNAIRKVLPDGTVSTLAGQAGQAGTANGALSAARFSLPAGIAIGADGSLFVADSENHVIRKID